MEIDIITYNHRHIFETAFKSSQNSIKIISPFIEKGAVNLLINAIKDNPDLNCVLITKFSDKDFIFGASSLEVLKTLIKNGVKIIAIKELHTKLYIFDNSIAIIGSANFTSGGFDTNIELSVQLKDNPDELMQLCKYFDDLLYKNKIYEVTEKMIDDKILKLKKYKEAQKIFNKKLPNDNFGGSGAININHDFDNLIGVLKFEGESNRRIESKQPYYPNEFDGFYFTCSPYNHQKPRKPIMLSSDKLLFLTIMSKDSKGNDAPMIVGRARTHGFNDNNRASEAMIAKYPDWLGYFAFYVKLYNVEIINANIENGISLYDIKNKTTHFPGWKQASYRKLTNETKNYINNLLEEKFEEFGKKLI